MDFVGVKTDFLRVKTGFLRLRQTLWVCVQCSHMVGSSGLLGPADRRVC